MLGTRPQTVVAFRVLLICCIIITCVPLVDPAVVTTSSRQRSVAYRSLAGLPRIRGIRHMMLYAQPALNFRPRDPARREDRVRISHRPAPGGRRFCVFI